MPAQRKVTPNGLNAGRRTLHAVPEAVGKARAQAPGKATEELLRELAEHTWILQLQDGLLRVAVKELRRRKVTWAQIGEALGVTRQTAWDRFAYLEAAADGERP